MIHEMANDKKDGWTCIDDIPFKIRSAFVPPPPVQLSVASAAMKFEEYDFSFERKVLEEIKFKEDLGKTPLETKSAPSPEQDSGSSAKPSKVIVPFQSQILLPNTQKSLGIVPGSCEQKNAKINLSDFENDSSSPFDYVELQTINDFEELSSVFQGLGNNRSSSNVNQDSSVGEHSLPKSTSFELTGSDAKLENSDNFFRAKSNSYVNQDSSAGQHSFPKSTSFALPGSDAKLENSNNCFRALPEYDTKLEYSENHLRAKAPDLSQASGVSNLKDVPFLPLVTAKNRSSEEDLSALSSSKSSLRSCKSYSDIHLLSEKCGNMFPCTPQKDLSLKDDSVFPALDVSCDKPVCLPDPYYELPEESRHFVDAVTGMGFSRGQVARTVKHLGADEKTVIEHLCQIQQLEDCGYDSLEAEAALHLHDYNQDQAKQFLDLINKFQDLGFEKNAVKKALIQNKNDESKTIDALLS